MDIDRPGAYSLRAPAVQVHAHDHDATGTTVFGFWLYLMSDCVLFGMIFATYAVVSNNTAGGPSGAELFDLGYVLAETFLLLVSSVTYGFGMLAASNGRRNATLAWLGVTLAFGLGFLAMEVNEFHHLIAEGHGPDVSAFLSAFFTLVGTHGLHVTAGSLWMVLMIGQVAASGLNEVILRRLMCLSLFWHFLDVVWICVFTVVYLLGAMHHG